MLGLRNPWRWSFDKATGDLWIGDVGQGEWEEVNFAPPAPAARTSGWNRREGKHAYNGGSPPAGNVDPIYDYAERSRLRGDRWLCLPRHSSCRVGRHLLLRRLLRRQGDGAHPHGVSGVRDTGLSTSHSPSFGEDRNGELYVLSQSGPLYRIDRA